MRVLVVALVPILSCGSFGAADSVERPGADASTNDAAGVVPEGGAPPDGAGGPEDGAVPDAGMGPILGSTKVTSDYWYNEPPGVPATAFQFDARYTGTVRTISVYLDGRTTPGCTVHVGLYDDAAGHPGTLLTQGALTSAVTSSWNTATVPPVVVTVGVKYWLAFLNPNGVATLSFRITGNGGTAVESAPDLPSLPSPWASNDAFAGSPGAAYASP